MKNSIVLLLNTILDNYAVIFFIDKKSSKQVRFLGTLILIASFINPLVGLCGLWGLLASLIFAWLLHFTDFSGGAHYYNFNSLLVSLGVGYFLGRSFNNYLILFGIVFLLALFVTVLSVSLENFLRTFLTLPVLSLPFVLVLLLTLAIYSKISSNVLYFESFKYLEHFLPHWFSFYLKGLGSIIFNPNLLSGALLLLVILIHSRISFLLSLIGFFVGYGVLNALGALTESTLMLLGFNTILTAIAIGGVFFVPDITSVLLGIFASALGVILGLGFQNFLAPWGLPVIAIPFNLVVLVILYGFKHRLSNIRPYLIPFYLGSPEENLEYYNMRILRFAGSSFYQFYLPLNGEWFVSQGNNDEITHKYDWQYAWDFEVIDNDGKNFIKDGTELTDYYAFDKPVLAPASGTVIKVVDWISDNPIGQVNTKDNWGNFIIIEHNPRLYSLLAHLKQNSVKVREGEFVKAGQVLASCGNSGRSLVPHLHFHVQTNPEAGSRTIKIDLVNYLRRCCFEQKPESELTWIKIGVPQKNECVSNLYSEPYLQEMLNFHLGNKLSYQVNLNGESFYEAWEVKIDFWGNLYLESTRKAKAIFSVYQGIFYLLKFEGNRKSALYALALALPSFAYVQNKSFTFTDQPPIISTLPFLVRIIHDALSFLTRPLKFKAHYQVLPETEEEIIISGGVGLYLTNFKLKSYKTRAEFNKTAGLKRLEVIFDHKNRLVAELLKPI
ncbi:MAG: urea transporter [candidate division WOR-3 bacterium]|nr:urea transporter [candidate division WOR-3 bacterium]